MMEGHRSKIDEYREMIERSREGIELAKKLLEEHRNGDQSALAKAVPKVELKREEPQPPKATAERIIKDKFGRREPILKRIKKDYLTTLLVMRWVEFMFERVKRDRITLVLDYYKDIGWISDEVKSEVMSYARGEVQDASKYVDEIEADIAKGEELTPEYKSINDWRLSAEDHLKSLLFIWKIAGQDVDKDEMNSLEQQITAFKRNLEGYHGV